MPHAKCRNLFPVFILGHCDPLPNNELRSMFDAISRKESPAASTGKASTVSLLLLFRGIISDGIAIERGASVSQSHKWKRVPQRHRYRYNQISMLSVYHGASMTKLRRCNANYRYRDTLTILIRVKWINLALLVPKGLLTIQCCKGFPIQDRPISAYIIINVFKIHGTNQSDFDR